MTTSSSRDDSLRGKKFKGKLNNKNLKIVLRKVIVHLICGPLRGILMHYERRFFYLILNFLVRPKKYLLISKI